MKVLTQKTCKKGQLLTCAGSLNKVCTSLLPIQNRGFRKYHPYTYRVLSQIYTSQTT